MQYLCVNILPKSVHKYAILLFTIRFRKCWPVFYVFTLQYYTLLTGAHFMIVGHSMNILLTIPHYFSLSSVQNIDKVFSSSSFWRFLGAWHSTLPCKPYWQLASVKSTNRNNRQILMFRRHIVAKIHTSYRNRLTNFQNKYRKKLKIFKISCDYIQVPLRMSN